MINKIPFKINWPIKIFDYSKKIDFQDKDNMESILERTIHYNHYTNGPNLIFGQRKEEYQFSLEKILTYLHKDYSPENILNISLFGSSLFSKNPEDYDFLIFVEGEGFKLKHTSAPFKEKIIEMSLSIKGVENYKRGPSKLQTKKQKNIINRTIVSLFRRRIPIYGFDFINNENLFLSNLDAQISDLLYNSYNAYYLENEKNFSEQKRSRKLLNRLYEAAACSEFKYSSPEINELRKDIHMAIKNNLSLEKSKKLYRKTLSVFSKKISNLGNI